MQVRVTVEVFSDKEEITTRSTQVAIAQGIICGDLDLKRGSEKQPVMSIKMPNILEQVRETIYRDSVS